jgi:AbrB family looped-hinge helix DNA binding protein
MPRLTSKGQVTIPKRIRDYLGLGPGSEVEFAPGHNGEITMKAAKGSQAKNRAESERQRMEQALAGLRGSAGPGMSTDEVMNLTRGWGEPDYDVK